MFAIQELLQYSSVKLQKLRWALLTVKEGKLRATIPNQLELELRPVCPDLFEGFSDPKQTGKVAFLRDTTGNVAFLNYGLYHVRLNTYDIAMAANS